jgi:hypothetical protein
MQHITVCAICHIIVGSLGRVDLALGIGERLRDSPSRAGLLMIPAGGWSLVRAAGLFWMYGLFGGAARRSFQSRFCAGCR